MILMIYSHDRVLWNFYGEFKVKTIKIIALRLVFKEFKKIKNARYF